MNIYKGLEHLRTIPNAVITTGTFDGVHIGHRTILNRVLQLSQDIEGESVVVTFDPHPRLVLFPDDNQLQLLSSLNEKLSLLESAGIHNVVIIPFTREFSRMTSLEYVRDILVKKMGLKKLVIGYDHHFGRNREGSIEQLQQFGPEFGFTVEEIPAQDIDAVNVSSTKIRNALRDGDILTANTYLTYPYFITGNVVDGQKRGRAIGFPTANIQPFDSHKLIPASGVYAIKATVNAHTYDGVVNIGYRPTVDGKNFAIEAHLFDFNADIYNSELKIAFYDRIRSEIKFSDIDALKNQIAQDVATAKHILA